MKRVIPVLILLLVILHQDFWFWHRYEPLVLGFLPIGLVWHVGISLSSVVIALLAVRYCWPVDVDVDDAESSAGGAGGSVDH